MILHLDSTSVTQAGNPGAVDAAEIGSRSSGRTPGSGSQDTIRISGASSALGRFATDRAARLAQLTAAVQNGSYRISGSAVASAIVAQSLPGES
jgi:anti-sigma28 factor (negative regulator of flagellin synthesis)